MFQNTRQGWAAFHSSEHFPSPGMQEDNQNKREILSKTRLKAVCGEEAAARAEKFYSRGFLPLSFLHLDLPKIPQSGMSEILPSPG